MSIAEEYIKRSKTPITTVEIIKHDGKPSVEPTGVRFHPEVISCDLSYGFDQGSASCTLVLKAPKLEAVTPVVWTLYEAGEALYPSYAYEVNLDEVAHTMPEGQFIIYYWLEEEEEWLMYWKGAGEEFRTLETLTPGYEYMIASDTYPLTWSVPQPQYSNVLFEPMNRVVVQQGWNKTSTLRTTFFGFIDRVEMSNPPQQMTLECRDILKLAENNYFINSNRKVYFTDVVEDEPDPNNPGGFMGGQPVEERQAQRIITDLLTESGIPSNRLNLDFLEYPAEGAIIIGNHAKAVFVYESALDAVSRICDLIGYRIWSDENGYIQCREVRAIASETASMSYSSQTEALNNDGTWTVINEGNLITVESNVDDDLRNWIEVISSHDENVSATVAGPSDYITSPPDYRRSEIRSFLLDTHELAIAVATRVYNDLNRLRYTAKATIEGDPRMTIGRTVEIYDQYVTQSSIKYFVYDFSSEFSSGNYTMTLGLTGGSGPGSLPISNVAPVAMFTYRVEREELANEDGFIEVFVDASDSYDPDGSDDQLTYAWTCEGFDSGSGITNSYILTSVVPYLTITLIVTDSGTPSLSNSITIDVPTSAAHGLVEVRSFYVASGTSVYTSKDGGKTWVAKELY